jgi:hypothetical protein
MTSGKSIELAEAATRVGVSQPQPTSSTTTPPAIERSTRERNAGTSSPFRDGSAAAHEVRGAL